ncbi:hypothetical protein [Kribbella monticola]|uniref:hypothetical protein n=1 Tax=Kribbella monticola TaxID=2185285 RepID=UPI00130021BC|nr:hypothetical protein [Kribbella monticola]
MVGVLLVGVGSVTDGVAVGCVVVAAEVGRSADLGVVVGSVVRVVSPGFGVVVVLGAEGVTRVSG